MNTTTFRTDCDALVVGAGPTGLTLAAQLLARGVRTRIIDKDPGTPRLSRAIGIQPRTLETLDMMGIVDRFLDAGHRVRGVTVYAGIRRLVESTWRTAGRRTGSSSICRSSGPRRCCANGSRSSAARSRPARSWSASPTTATSSPPPSGT